MKKYFDSYFCDIGLTFVETNPTWQYANELNEKYKKKFVDIKNQLKYKYLISIEGNDVATDLKWKLYSNSVIFMKKPTVVSWLMEDKLKPYIHYIPIAEDFSDLEEKYIWAIKNDDKCFEISQNAKYYIEQFLDEENEIKIQCEILKKYFENLIIEY